MIVLGPTDKTDPETVVVFERLVPDDLRALRGQMFGHPCAFVFGQMFLGTHGRSVVFRLGEARAKALAVPPVAYFEPVFGRPWRDYVQVERDAMAEDALAALAREALEFTAKLPPKAVKPAKKPKA